MFNLGSNASSILSIPPVVTSVEAGSRGMFPLMLKHAVQYVKSRTVLIGDAAHRIHPMAGQGVNLGFGDAKCLVKAIENSVKCGKDFGKYMLTSYYVTEIQILFNQVKCSFCNFHRICFSYFLKLFI